MITILQQIKQQIFDLSSLSKEGFGIVVIVMYAFSLHAQPTIQNTILPTIGDTIILANDNLPEGIYIFPNKGEQEWDFMDLQSAFSKKNVAKKVSEQLQKNGFSEADIYMEDLRGVKKYYHLHEDELKLVGAIGIDEYGIGIELESVYQPTFSILKTPIEYGSIQNTSGQFSSVVPANQLPVTLLYSLPILPDSVRFVSTIETSEEVDAWGHLVLPDNSFEVLRARRIMAIRTKLEVKAGLFPWRDVTDEIFTTFFQKEKIILSYHFYSNEAPMPVVIATMKEDGISVENIEYVVSDPSSVIRHTSDQPDIYAYPNPAINEVRFEFSNLPPANYTLKIVNIFGQPIMEKEYQLSGFRTIKWNVSKLRKGTYLYSLVNEKGNAIATRRLMVIRP